MKGTLQAPHFHIRVTVLLSVIDGTRSRRSKQVAMSWQRASGLQKETHWFQNPMAPMLKVCENTSEPST